MQTSMTSMTSVVWGRLFETVYGDFRDFHGLAELGRPFLEMRGRNAGHPPCGTERRAKPAGRIEGHFRAPLPIQVRAPAGLGTERRANPAGRIKVTSGPPF